MARKALDAGTRISRFEVLDELSQDAIGFVYSGRYLKDHSGTKSVIIREYAPASLVTRQDEKIAPIRRELQSEFHQARAAEINKYRRYNELLIKGLSLGRDQIEANGTVYLVVEKESGESLAETLKSDGKFSPGFTRSILNDILPGLKRLEDKKLVHSLISSETILRTADGNFVLTSPYALQNVESEDTDAVVLPTDSPFLAPEFTHADSGKIGLASDVYSLCASLYHVITGQIPASASDRYKAMENGDADPLNLPRLETLLKDDPALYSVIKSGLHLMVDERLASMAKLEAVMYMTPVDADLSDEDVSTGLAANGAPSGWWDKYGRSLLAGGAVLALLLISIPLFLYLDQSSSGPGGTDLAETEVEASQVQTAENLEGPPQQASVMSELPDATNAPEDTPVLDAGVEANEAEPEGLSQSVADWLAVDQSDPAAILAFMERDGVERSVYRQARARWMTLEAEGWAAAREDGRAESVRAFLEMYGETPPEFAAFYSPAQAYLETLVEDDADETVETQTPEDTEALQDEDVASEPEDVAPVDDEESEPAVDEPAETIAPEPAPAPEVSNQDCDECPPLASVSLGGESLSVGVHEVTVGEFRAYLAATGRSAPQGCFTHRTGSASVWGYSGSASFEAPGYSVTDDHPAVCVSFDEASAFADWISAETGKNYRLLSAEEWSELAGGITPSALACGGGNFADATLNGEDVQLEGMSCQDGSAFASSVSGDTDRVTGLYGNVEEWVSTCVNGDCSKRSAMGGSWASVPGQIRSNLQTSYTPNSRSSTLGFRIVRID